VVGFEEYHDPRLVALYDLWDPSRADIPFYLQLATELSATSAVDIGCGTGVLACELARRGLRVTGVDPSPTMLEVARRRPGGELVRWIEGDAGRLGAAAADLAVMTGHVAQVIGDDQSWHGTLAATHTALRPGGHLAFESRNPSAREWSRWTPQATRRRLHHPDLGQVEVWQQVVQVEGDQVTSEIHYRFAASGDELVSTTRLRFRTQAELSRSLTDTSFSVEHVYGDWDRQPVEPASPELIFVAVRQEVGVGLPYGHGTQPG
jgi:SAM-dependent methyltransferase